MQAAAAALGTQLAPRRAGAFTVITFVTAILWLNTAAGMLVNVSLVAGRILGVEPALLGATVLAWGNSLPDLVNNMALARDGFPTMALAACFASPLFQMLAGMALGLSVGGAALAACLHCAANSALVHLGPVEELSGCPSGARVRAASSWCCCWCCWC
jgi:Ca2+/Na+ antiporter